VEVQNHFVNTPTRIELSGNGTGTLASKVFSVVADPLFAGTAAPGAVVVGRIYNQCGALAGESMLTTDVDGRWEMSFAGTKALKTRVHSILWGRQPLWPTPYFFALSD